MGSFVHIIDTDSVQYPKDSNHNTAACEPIESHTDLCKVYRQSIAVTKHSGSTGTSQGAICVWSRSYRNTLLTPGGSFTTYVSIPMRKKPYSCISTTN